MFRNTLILSVFIGISILFVECSKSNPTLDPINSDLKNGLQAYYPFSNNANDASGNGNNGTIVNVSLIKDRFGNTNSAMNFSGINGTKISTSYSGIIGSQSRTVSLWYRYTTPFANHTSIISYGGDPNKKEQDFGIFISTLGGSGSPYIGVMANNPIGSYVGNYFAKIKDGQWHHYVFTFDNTLGKTLDKIKIYVDGVLVPNNVSYQNNFSQTPDIINTNSTLPLVFGQFTSYNGATSGDYRSFAGDLDDVGIWSRSLTQTEISFLFNNDLKL